MDAFVTLQKSLITLQNEIREKEDALKWSQETEQRSKREKEEAAYSFNAKLHADKEEIANLRIDLRRTERLLDDSKSERDQLQRELGRENTLGIWRSFKWIIKKCKS